MLRWFAVVALVAAPGAQACVDSLATAALDLEFEKPCKRDAVDDCPVVPDADAPYSVEGLLVWSWEVDAQCGVAVPSPDPIHVHLTGLERHFEGWLEVTAEPSEVTLEPTDQWDLTDDDVDPVTGRIVMRESVPIRAIVSLVGEPSPEGMGSLRNRQGVATVDLRAAAGETPAFLSVSDLESFLFDGRDWLEADGKQDGSRLSVPSPAFPLALAAVALAALVRRAA